VAWRLTSIPILYFAYAAVRMVAAAIIALRARNLGASLGVILAQGLSDVSLSLGILAFAQRSIAQRLGGVLELLVTYAIIWETYAWMTRIAAQRDDASQDDLSAGSIAGPIFGAWELLAVIPGILMASIGVESRRVAFQGDYLFESNALDALVAAGAGVAVLIWVSWRAPSSRPVSWLLRGLGILLLLVALWVWS
jgi:hypothetical protein